MIFDWFWNDRFWLPEALEWKDLEPRVINGTFMQIPQFRDLRYSIFLGVGLLALRILIESFLFLPIGVLGGWMKLQQGTSTLHICFRHLNFGFLGKSKFKRVAESGWRFLYYLSIWIYGIYVLRDQPQWSNIDESWKNYPYQGVNDAIWYYYLVETGFYWSLLFSAFTIDVRRSDFWEMAIHHAITIILLSLSFTVNFVRIGTMVLICHDTADIILEAGKLMRYAGWEKPLMVTFCALFFTWVTSRIFYFPLVIIRSVIVAAPSMIQDDFKWLDLLQRPIVPRVFLFMLCALVCLHVFWTILLFQIAYKTTQKGDDLNDIREDTSEDDETDEKKKE